MAHDDERSLQQIKRETEQTRAGLTDTVEQLRASVTETASDIRQRISPEAIKAEVTGYIRSRGEQLMADMTSAARNNPMQAVAVGASVAYPLLRIARAIPMPVLLVGAGLFFAGSKTGQAATKKASEFASDLSHEAGRRAREFGDQVAQSASDVKDMAVDGMERAKGVFSDGSQSVRGAAAMTRSEMTSRAENFQDKAASLGSSVADQMTELKDRTLRMAGSATDSVQGTASDVASTVRHAANSAVDMSFDAVKAARERAADLGERAGKTISGTIEQNPLLVAGLGLVLGGILASALPRSHIEDGLIGNASDAVKKRAQDAASDGFATAKNAVGELYQNAAAGAEAEGLTTDGLSNAANDIGQRVRRVAEAGIKTAFPPAADDNNNNAPGKGRDHG